MQLTKISNLKKGEKAIIESFENNVIAQRLISMGLRPGSSIELVSKAPFNGGYYLKIDRQRIVIRTKEAKTIILKQ